MTIYVVVLTMMGLLGMIMALLNSDWAIGPTAIYVGGSMIFGWIAAFSLKRN